MIDTIHAKFRSEIHPSDLDLPWKMYTSQRDDGTLKVFYLYNLHNDHTSIRCKYFPLDYSYEPLLIVYVASASKLVQGDNFENLSEISPYINQINQVIQEDSNMPDIDFGDGIPDRVDFYYDYYLDSLLDPYLEGISKLLYPKKSRSVHYNYKTKKNGVAQDNGVVFYSTQEHCKFYNKFRQCGCTNAYGILRQEHKINDMNLVLKYFDAPRIKDLSKDVAKFFLQRDLERLGLDKGILTNNDGALEQLKKKYPDKKAYEVYLNLVFINSNCHLNKNELANKRGVTVQTINNWLREIQSAGLAPSMLVSPISLPPLFIP